MSVQRPQDSQFNGLVPGTVANGIRTGETSEAFPPPNQTEMYPLFADVRLLPLCGEDKCDFPYPVVLPPQKTDNNQ